MIKSLRYDYSSWSLRDTAAAGKTKDKSGTAAGRRNFKCRHYRIGKTGITENKTGKREIWQLLEDDLQGNK